MATWETARVMATATTLRFNTRFLSKIYLFSMGDCFFLITQHEIHIAYGNKYRTCLFYVKEKILKFQLFWFRKFKAWPLRGFDTTVVGCGPHFAPMQPIASGRRDRRKRRSGGWQTAPCRRRRRWRARRSSRPKKTPRRAFLRCGDGKLTWRSSARLWCRACGSKNPTRCRTTTTP